MSAPANTTEMTPSSYEASSIEMTPATSQPIDIPNNNNAVATHHQDTAAASAVATTPEKSCTQNNNTSPSTTPDNASPKADAKFAALDIDDSASPSKKQATDSPLAMSSTAAVAQAPSTSATVEEEAVPTKV